MTKYINDEALRTVFHIPSDAPAWEQCSTTVDYHLQHEASLWIYDILRFNYRILFYCGDTDAAVACHGTRKWLKKLNWAKTSDWRPWNTDNQVTGYTESYEGLDLVTIHGVGHMAPQWARKPTTTMINNWIKGNDI